MSKETLAEIDKQIVAWVEQLDKLYIERSMVSVRIVEIEERLSSMKHARRALAAEWGETAQEVPIPLKYTAEGVTEVIEDVLSESPRSLTVGEVATMLLGRGFDFGGKNPRRVVNMALINDTDIVSDGSGKYRFEPELPF